MHAPSSVLSFASVFSVSVVASLRVIVSYLSASSVLRMRIVPGVRCSASLPMLPSSVTFVSALVTSTPSTVTTGFLWYSPPHRRSEATSRENSSPSASFSSHQRDSQLTPVTLYSLLNPVSQNSPYRFPSDFRCSPNQYRSRWRIDSCAVPRFGTSGAFLIVLAAFLYPMYLDFLAIRFSLKNADARE